MVLRYLAITANAAPDPGLIKNHRVIQTFGLPMFHGAAYLESIRTADHFVDRAKAQLGHMLAHLLGDEAHEIHHVGWIALKFLAQFGILRGDSHRAGVEMTDPHHDATQGYQGSSCETEFLGAAHRCDND